MSLKNTKIAQPYATALLEVVNKNLLENIIQDCITVSSTVESSEDLRKLLANPLVNSQTKKTTVKSIFSDKVGDKMLRFLLVLCDRGRIFYLESIIEKSLELAYKEAHIETVKVTTSVPLSTVQQDTLVSKLKKMTGAEQVKLEISLDSNLLGGFIVQIQSKIIDTSIQGQLKRLESHLGTFKID